MKKIVGSFILLTLLVGCNSQNVEITKGDLETTIFFASDLHLYSKNLIGENNQKYLKKNFTSDGRVQEYDYELVKGLIDEVNNQKIDYLVLSGDLSYNGEKDSLLELKKLLSDVNKETKVLVIPGNHDCYSLTSFSCLNDEYTFEEGVTYSEFKEIFKDYGYSNAYSYDETSLSYIYELSEDKWILMLDTSQSEYNYEMDFNIVSGYLDEGTLNWLEENLKYAKENNIEVISSSHHNLLVHNKLFKINYTLYNSEALLDLYAKYHVRINFSGHLHIQSIKSEDINDYEIYDVASGSLLDYGNRFGKLEIYDNCYNYEASKISVNIDALDFNQYSFDNFYNEYYNKSLITNEIKYGKDAIEVTDFLSKCNAYYFDGDYEKINELIKENKSLYRKIKRKIENYKETYVGSLLEVENKNQHKLLIEK